MRSDPEAIIAGLYAAWSMQDVEATLAYCSDDIVYFVHQPDGANWIGGEISGKPAVRAYLQMLRDTWEFLLLTPGPFDIRGGEVREYLQFRSRHRATGQVMEGHKRHIWQIIDGRITRCEEFQDAAVVAAFLRMVSAPTH